MGMRALAINAEAVERRRMRCGEIAVGTAAGGCIQQIEADFGGELPGMFVQRGTGIALLVRRPVQTADDLDADAFGTRFQVQDSRNEIVAVRNRQTTTLDLSSGLIFGNDAE